MRFAGPCRESGPRYRPGRDFASIAFWGNFPTFQASKYVFLRIAKSPRTMVVCSHGETLTATKPKIR